MATKRTSTAKLEARVSQLEAALERVRMVGEALRRVTLAVGATGRLDELLQLIVDTTTEVLNCDRATLYLLDADGVLVSHVTIGDELREIRMDVGEGIAGHVAKTGRPLRIKDAYRDQRFDPSWDQKSGYRTKSILAVPLRNREGRIVGVLQVLNKTAAEERAQVFTPYDKELLAALAAQTAVALEKDALFISLRAKNELLQQTTERLERTLCDLELLLQLETQMSHAESVEGLARSVVNLVGHACSAQAGALLYLPMGGELTLYVVNLDEPTQVRQVIVQEEEGIAARAMAQGKMLRIDDPKKVRDPRRVRELLGISVKSAIAAPLGSDEGTFSGALALYNHSTAPFRFTEADARLLELVSANVGTELRVQDSRVQRERAERLGSIGRLLSGVMHDLRTPLTVISGYVQLMQVTDDAVVRAEYGDTISEQFATITAMQRDLLAYARGETPLLIRKIYLGHFFERLAKQFRPAIEDAGIDLDMQIENSGAAYFDERGIARAVGNLVRNAIEAMESRPKGTLSIICQQDDQDLVLRVRDTGKGIPKAIRDNLFEPFVTKGKKLGTGLGLANVKDVVAEHGGTVDVESSRRGTCFTVRIPNAMRPYSLRLGGHVPVESPLP